MQILFLISICFPFVKQKKAALIHYLLEYKWARLFWNAAFETQKKQRNNEKDPENPIIFLFLFK